MYYLIIIIIIMYTLLIIWKSTENYNCAKCFKSMMCSWQIQCSTMSCGWNNLCRSVNDIDAFTIVTPRAYKLLQALQVFACIVGHAWGWITSSFDSRCKYGKLTFNHSSGCVSEYLFSGSVPEQHLTCLCRQGNV